ncbi:MAG TPA: PQQ-binding-like beta-propeller repeat protein [Candidatus Dormibacteraeota bacterium]|nr:PQQ-binding-like beta-propeller repeat protein [Candidatus Dormibacteraeota bacterium]
MRFAHVTDVHLSVDRGDPRGGLEFTARHGDGTDVEAALDAAFIHAAGRGAGLALVTGDLTEHGTTAEFRRFASRARAAPLPVWTVPGNHDHYGHLHDPDPADRPRGEGFLGSATVGRYESVMGARWWSRDHGSLHVVGLDWFSALCGIDAEEQRDFLATDLGHLPDGTQVLLLSHDQLDPGWFDHIRDVAPQVRVIGALSGHCHSPKLVADDEGCQHVSTGSVSFGGLDWSPPQIRFLDWDGSRLTVGPPERARARRAVRRPSPPPGNGRARRSWLIGGGQHLAGGAVDGEELTVAADDPDSPGAVVVGFDSSPGARWLRQLPGTPITGLAAGAGAVVCITQSGGVHCLAAADGEPRWSRQLGDPCRNRLMSPPVLTPDGAVVAGNLAAVAALDLAHGEPRWLREDLGPVDTLLTLGAGVCAGSTVVLPFSGPHRGLTGLRLGDGGVDWTDPPGAPPPLSGVVPVGDGDALVVRDGPLLERFALASGEVRWRLPLRGRFSTAAPHHDGDRITVVTGDGILHRVEARSGELERELPLAGVREGYGPYRTSGAGAPTAPVRVAGELVIVLVDGSVWALPSGSEGTRLLADLATEVTAQPVAFAGGLAVVDTAGVLHLVDVAPEAAVPGPG